MAIISSFIGNYCWGFIRRGVNNRARLAGNQALPSVF